MASIIKRCDCDGWNKCPRSWIVRYRTEGGWSGRQRERSFGGDLGEAEDFVLKVAHDKKARVFIDPEAGKAVFRAEAEAWLSQRIGEIRRTVEQADEGEVPQPARCARAPTRC